MTINLDTEIVATRFDPKTRECFYTIERNGRQWTAVVKISVLDQHDHTPLGKKRRANHVANLLEEAMRGPDDKQKAAAEIVIEETVYTFGSGKP